MLRTSTEIPDWLDEFVRIDRAMHGKPWSGMYPYEGWANERLDELGRWLDDGGLEIGQ